MTTRRQTVFRRRGRWWGHGLLTQHRLARVLMAALATLAALGCSDRGSRSRADATTTVDGGTKQDVQSGPAGTNTIECSDYRGEPNSDCCHEHDNGGCEDEAVSACVIAHISGCATQWGLGCISVAQGASCSPDIAGVYGACGHVIAGCYDAMWKSHGECSCIDPCTEGQVCEPGN